jgi:hypothetical protein
LRRLPTYLHSASRSCAESRALQRHYSSGPGPQPWTWGATSHGNATAQRLCARGSNINCRDPESLASCSRRRQAVVFVQFAPCRIDLPMTRHRRPPYVPQRRLSRLRPSRQRAAALPLPDLGKAFPPLPPHTVQTSPQYRRETRDCDWLCSQCRARLAGGPPMLEQAAKLTARTDRRCGTRYLRPLAKLSL